MLSGLRLANIHREEAHAQEMRNVCFLFVSVRRERMGASQNDAWEHFVRLDYGGFDKVREEVLGNANHLVVQI